MPQTILSNDTGSLRFATSPLSILAIVCLWLAFACGLPFYRLQEARHQVHDDLFRLSAEEKLDAKKLNAAFDRSNQKLDAAAFGLCLILALSLLLLVNRFAKLKRQYNTLANDLTVWPRQRDNDNFTMRTRGSDQSPSRPTNGSSHMHLEASSVPVGQPSSSAASTPRNHAFLAVFATGWHQAVQWLPTVMATLLWLTLVCGLPFQTLRDSRRMAKDELAYLLQTPQPGAPAILNTFDRATEPILFAISGPYFVVGIAMLFLVAQLIGMKRRLFAAERNTQALRDVVLGVNGVPLR